MTAREVIRAIQNAVAEAQGHCRYETAVSILAALSAAPEAVRLDLARQLAGDAHRVVPVEPTEEMQIAGGMGLRLSDALPHDEQARVAWLNMLAAAQEDQR